MLGNLLKILLFFFAIYLVYNFIRSAIALGSRGRRRGYEKERDENMRDRGGRGRNRVIELDKDQYKVE